MQLPSNASWIRLAVTAFATATIVAVMLLIALSGALIPRANAQSQCLKVTMMEESEADYILHLVDENGRRLGLSNRDLGKSITLTDVHTRNYIIYIEIDHTREIVEGPAGE